MAGKRVQTVLEQLNYDWDNFTVDDFIRHLMQRRQRQIVLMGVAMDVSGLCVTTDRRDYIFYDLYRHPGIQLHAILHEAAHLILKHTAYPLSVDDIQHLNLGYILLHINMRARGIYHNPQMKREEDEAEFFAFLSQRAIAEGQRRRTASVTDISEDTFIPPFTGQFRNLH
jgi:hypothetical protein